MYKGYTINNNSTDLSEREIIDALEADLKAGNYAVVGNSAAASDPTSEPYQRIKYTQCITIGDEDVMLTWRPTEETYARALITEDESDACDWDTIDKVECV